MFNRKEYFNNLKVKGRCPSHPNRSVIVGKCKCQECLSKQNISNQKYYNKLRSTGKCLQCASKNVVSVKRYCQKCLNNKKERYENSKLNGKCPKCSPPVIAGVLCLKCLNKGRKWNQYNKIHCLWYDAKRRALRDNVSFNITEQDIRDIIPKDNKCPIFNRKFEYNKNLSWSMTLDKIIPEKGYIKGNIQIISHKANSMKYNATPKELIIFAKWALKNR